MTQEEKELLLKDLGTRLAYHPVIYGKEGFSTNEGVLTSVTTSGVFINTKGGSTHHYFIEEIKPYLRSLASMTEEEKVEYDQLCYNCQEQDSVDYNITQLDRTQLIYVIDWLNSHHFDYRELIEKGLALEAPKKMYETKTE